MKKYAFFAGILFLICSIGINIFLLSQKNSSPSPKDKVVQLGEKYPYISQRVLAELPQDILVSFLDLRQELRKDTTQYGNSFGLYFEYLPTGTSININGLNEFHAASLFKLPVVMAYYHYKHRLGIQDDQQITLTKDMLDKQFGNLWQKGAGYTLKASDAVRLALTESDNTAARSLVPFIDKQDFDSVYEGLDIDLQSDTEGAILTAKSYSSILKALYYSSVLDKDASEEILDYLTKTKFPDKLAAGVPISVPIAHKIGDYNDDRGNEAFMDCGIVYVPRRPYILCMLSVTDEQTARQRMQMVSKTIYDYVSSAD